MITFLKELTRRKVWLFGGIYLALGWVLLQVAIAIEATMKLPDWVDQITLVMLGLGFPVALLLAWAQESRSENASSTGLEPETSPAEQISKDLWIVVLPFRARANDEIEQLVAEGLTDDITGLLTSVKGIKVAPRQAVGRTLAADDDALQIARNLNGRYALTGSVRRDGGKLRVSAELTDLVDNEQKWSQQFDRLSEDLFAIQDEIAKGVVGLLGGAIARVEGARALRQPPDKLQAWELVRRAAAMAWDFRPETLEQGLRDARHAIRVDPNYDVAHAWTALILAWRSIQGWSPDAVAEREEALREADECVRLGFDNPESLFCGIEANWLLGRSQAAVQIYENAVARRPDFFLSYPYSFVSMGVAYAQAGRPQESSACFKIFEDMFPNDVMGAVWSTVMRGYAQLACRNYVESEKLHANSPSEYGGVCRMIALININEIEEAKGEFERLQSANPDIDLDHYIEHFKGYHVDVSIGAELSDALVRLKKNLKLGTP